MTAHVTLEHALGTVPRVSPQARPGLLKTAQDVTASRGVLAGLMLALRYVQARMLSIWGLLIAAYLCPPQAFAAFAIYAALANVLSIATLLRFEAVFFQSSDSTSLGRAFRLSLATGGCFLALAGLGALVSAAAGLVPATQAGLFLLSLAGRAVIRLVIAEATADGDFGTIGNTGICQAVVQPSAMLLLILCFGASSTSLFAADAIGHLIAALYICRRRLPSLTSLSARAAWSWHELRAAAWRWRAAPTFFLPSTLLSFGFSIAPLLALPFAGNAVLAAQVALAMRLLDVPTQMFGAVSGPLLMSHLRAPQWQNHRRVRLMTGGLLVLATAMFVAIAGVALFADQWLVGTRWQGVGMIMAVLAAFYAGVALVSPLTEIGTIASDPQHAMLANAAAIVAMLAAVAWFGTLSVSLLATFGVISLLRMVVQAGLAWIGAGLAMRGRALR